MLNPSCCDIANQPTLGGYSESNGKLLSVELIRVVNKYCLHAFLHESRSDRVKNSRYLFFVSVSSDLRGVVQNLIIARGLRTSSGPIRALNYEYVIYVIAIVELS